MIDTVCKRLIEFDLPIGRISALRNKRSRSGDVDVRKIGIWWSRKPQHQARAIWLALLLPDPTDSSCPADVIDGLRSVVRGFGGLSEEGTHSNEALRHDLLQILPDLSDPGIVNDERITGAIEALNEQLGWHALVALDPFSGSGAYPVEAARLGLHVVAGEYNPLALQYLRLLLEWPHKVTEESLQESCDMLNQAANQALAAVQELHPPHPKHGSPLGYIFWRQVRCEGPGCGSVVPATSKFVLDAQACRGLRFSKPLKPGDEISLELCESPTEVFPDATIQAGALACPACGFRTKRPAVMAQRLREPLSPRLVAVVYRGVEQIIAAPTEDQVDALNRSLRSTEQFRASGLWPDARWPRTELRRFSPPLYGYLTFAACHTERQLLFLGHLTNECAKTGGVSSLGRQLGALVVANLLQFHTALCRWRNDRGGTFVETFAGKSLGMMWDYFEVNPCHPDNAPRSVIESLSEQIRNARKILIGESSVLGGPAQELALPDDSVDVLFTDPPYYDAIPYSHLSDWPLVWAEKVCNVGLDCTPDNLSPKSREIVVDRPHSKSPSTHDGRRFATELESALRKMRDAMKDDSVGVIVFAHLETSAWEALLEALCRSGFVVTASWPIATERGGRLQAQGTASLQSSVHLVVRPRRSDRSPSESVGEWRDVLAQLPRRIKDWLPRLSEEGITGADAIFACLGPAIELFSRWDTVEKASGETVALRDYLPHVWAAVSSEALSMIFEDADVGGLEADARLTAMWLWTLSGARPEDSSGVKEEKRRTAGGELVLEFDAARLIAQGFGINLEKSESIVEVKGDSARLLPVAERIRHLFGKEGAEDGADRSRRKKKQQLNLFEELEAIDAEIEISGDGRFGGLDAVKPGSTALDKVHQSMVFFASGRGEALRRFLVDDGVGNDGKFWNLAEALSKLYPSGCDEQRWVDGVLARKKGLRF